MSRIKSRVQTEICGDCGASDPAWVSVNRGILLCAECCSVHRSLGRHISQVKSLRQGVWPPAVLNFVNTLNSHGANNVWEHYLLDVSTVKNLRTRKPNSKDSIHPVKSDFIRAKHVNLAFVLKPSVQDENNTNLEVELSKQLHASVRAPNLETSLRLLVQGADPNYYHEDKGNTPLHVAVKSGQSAQVELLIIYGADLMAHDSHGRTPLELSKTRLISDRLVESMYEVTDKFSYYLTGKRPDHQNGQHFIIPDQNKHEINDQLKLARNKLQLIPNKMFEELVMDLYDEVDRRETEAIWATSSLNPETGAVLFLPTNPHLSATRNQGRQKLARFNPVEFAGLLTDVLIDARRRQNLANLRPMNIFGSSPNKSGNLENEANSVSDDEPLYDAVASDDDYAALAPVVKQNSNVNIPTTVGGIQQKDQIEVLKQQLEQSESTINELKNLVQKLSSENFELKSKIQPSQSPVSSPGGAKNIESLAEFQSRNDATLNQPDAETEPVSDSRQSSLKRPVSMYETRESPFTKLQLPESRTTTSMYQMANQKTTLPSTEEVNHRTDLVTRRIQELWTTMQGNVNKNSYVPCAERIRVAVAELITIFPQNISDDTIKNALKQLNTNTNLLQAECSGLQHALLTDNIEISDMYMQEVRNCAYYLAMATKTLVTKFQQTEQN